MTSETKPPRKERERQRHRQEILSVALKLFSEKGFHNVSMQEIAGMAEFATGTIYNFFDSKEALYREIMDGVAESVLTLMTPILTDEGDEREKIARFIKATIRVSRENSAAIRLFLQANQGVLASVGATQLTERIKEVHETIQTMLWDVLAAGIRKGVFRATDPHVAAMALDAALRELVLSVAQNAPEAALEQKVADLENLFFRGILHARNENDAWEQGSFANFLPTVSLGMALGANLEGIEAGTFKRGDRHYDIVVEPADEPGRDQVARFLFPGAPGQPIRLSNLADVEQRVAPAQITRQDKRRVTKMFANLKPELPLGTAVNRITDVIDSEGRFPPGYDYRFAGVYERMAEAVAAFGEAGLMAAILGMLPLALSRGIGAEMRTGVGIASVRGILISGVLTLILLPILYDLMTRKSTKR